MDGTYAGLLNYKLPVPEETQGAIAKRIWLGMQPEICGALNWNADRIDKFEEEQKKILRAYVDIFSENHIDERQKLFYGGWQTNEHDTRPPWLHLSPQKSGDSDVINVFRYWEIPDNKSIIKDWPGKYTIAKGEVFVPNRAEAGLNEKYRGKTFNVVKIIVPAGPFNGGYAELMFAADEEAAGMPARLKVSPAGVYKIYTDHETINQVVRDINNSGWGGVPPYAYEGLARAMHALEIEGNRFEFKPEIDCYKIDEEFRQPPEPLLMFPQSPHEFYARLLAEYRLKTAKEQIEERKSRDFSTAINILVSMKKGECPRDALVGQMCLAYLSEPDSFRTMQNQIYENMSDVISALKNVDSWDVRKKIPEAKLEKLSTKAYFVETFIFDIPFSFLPPNMDLLAGESEALGIINAVGKIPASLEGKPDRDLLEYYKEGKKPVKISFLENDAPRRDKSEKTLFMDLLTEDAKTELFNKFRECSHIVTRSHAH